MFRHGSIDPSKVLFTSDGLDSLLKQNVKLTSSNKKNEQHLEHGTGEEANQAVTRSYESLVKLLRSLDLPLSFHSIQGLSPVLRGTEVSLVLTSVYYMARIRFDASCNLINEFEVRILP